MQFNQKIVPLSAIDSDDGAYCITTKQCIKGLAKSIQAVGLINPPILTKKKSQFIIVCGFRRIAAYQYMGLSHIEAKITDSSVSELECIKLAITDNALARPLNLVEQSKAFYMFLDHFEDTVSMGKTAALLGLPENPSMINKIISIYYLPQQIQRCIIRKTLSLPIALELSKLEKEVSVYLAGLFDDLKLSLSKQREIIILIKEIAAGEDTPIMEIFQEKRLKQIINHKDLDRTQKTRDIRMYLKQRRFPAIMKAEREFNRNVKELKLGENIRLVPPKNFEAVTYCLSLYFKNIKEFNGCRAKLNKISQNHTLEKIFWR